MPGKNVIPTKGAEVFTCPHCGAYAQQEWPEVRIDAQVNWRPNLPNISVSECLACQFCAVWLDDRVLHPNTSPAPPAVDDMPEHVKADYLEARDIVDKSPRAAAALLRLALERLLRTELEVQGKDLNDAIGSLVAKGLPEEIQQAMDSVRVFGNEAVHPGQIDLGDDAEIARLLFYLVNWIVEDKITRPTQIREMYGRIADSKKRKPLQQ